VIKNKNMKCVIVQNNAVHEAIIPTFIKILNELSITVVLYLNSDIKEKFGDLFVEFDDLDCTVNYVVFKGVKAWDVVKKDILKEQPDFLFCNTFNLKAPSEWAMSMGLPTLGVVHNVERFTQGGIYELMHDNVQLVTLSGHVTKSLAARVPNLDISRISTIEPVVWPNDIKAAESKNNKRIGVPGSVNFDNRDYESLVSYFKSKPDSTLIFVILGGGRDRSKLEQLVHDEDIKSHFEFVPKGNSGFVMYDEYVKKMQSCSFVDPLIAQNDSYTKSRITSAVTTAVGFGKPVYLTQKDYEAYGVVSLNFSFSHHEFLDAINEMDDVEYNFQIELIKKNKDLMFYKAKNELKTAIKNLYPLG
jgi:hypothetical protein